MDNISDHLDDQILNYINPECIALRENLSIKEVMAELRQLELPEKIIYFYVVDEDNRLVGVIPTRKLLMSNLTNLVKDICIRRVVAIPANYKLFDALELFVLYKFLAFPVVDEERKLMGSIDVKLFTNEMMNLEDKTETDDIFQLIGIKISQERKVSAFKNFTQRFPWLISNIIGGILCAVISSLYEATLAKMMVMALFIPVILALSESISIQSMSITIALIHQRQSKIWKAVWQELKVTFLIALASGMIIAMTAWLWKKYDEIFFIIFFSILCAMLTASFFGVLLPRIIHKLGKDPKIAAGPIVLAAGDIMTLIYYFNAALLFLR
jgi:magnesium transporter